MQATGFRSLANASHPTRNASRGIEPPPANGSTTTGDPSSYEALTSARLTSRKDEFDERSQFANFPTNCRRACRRSASVAPGWCPTSGSRVLAVTLKASGQYGSHGSGQSAANRMALLEANGRRAHHRCKVEGWPCLMDFSLAACRDTSAIGKSTSAKRRHSFGIMRPIHMVPGLQRSPSAVSLRSPTGSSGRPSSPRSSPAVRDHGQVPASAVSHRSR